MSRLLPLILVVVGGWLGARLPLTDSGYLDLAQGRQFVDTGRITPPDTVLAADRPEKTSGWTGSWLLFRIHRAGGERALRLLAALCLGGGALLLYLIRPGGAGFVSAGAAVSLAASTLDISTSLFSWPLLAAMVLCLTTLRERNKWWLLLLLVPLGGWPFLNRDAALGLGLAGLAILTELIRAILAFRRRAPNGRWVVLQEPSLLIAVGAVTAILITASPEGWQKIENPLAEAALLQKAGVSRWDAVSVGEDTRYFVLAAATGLLALAMPPLAMPLETMAMAAFLFLSLVSRHFIMYFAGVAVPPVSRSLVVLGGRISSARHSLLRPLTSQWAALLAGATFILPAAITPPEQHPFQTATRFLSEHTLERPIFNVPASGGLATWVGGPELMPLAYLRPRSIEAFEQEIAARRLAQIFEDNELDVALVDREFAERERDQIAEIQDLKLLFFDDVALLYARVPSSPGPLSDISFHYFDPLKAPSDYPPETVPLAIQELFAHYDRYPPSPTTLRTLGALLLRAERREEALEAFEASQRLDPKDLETLRALSRLYIDKGMYGLAEKSARQALRLTRDEEFTYNLALALYGQGRYADAARQFESVLELNADNLKARRALVDLYRQLGQLEQSYLQKRTLDAMEEFKTAAMLTKAQERSDALDFEGAARFYVQALEISRDQPEILWDLAMVLLTDNRVDAATVVLRNLIDVAPRHTVARLTLGVLCARESTCTTEEAKAHLEAFLALAPDDLNAELAKQELEKLE